jgi:chemotaxis protein MotB
MAGNNSNAIIIKRVKKGGHGGHHGGAWKVAYADFVTAMMAFFLLMWLINTTTPEQKRGIADYFAAQSISQTLSGSGGVLGGRVLGEDSAKAGGAPALMQKKSPPSVSDPTHSKDQSKATQVASNMDRAVSSSQDSEFQSAAEAIRQSIQENPDIAQLSKQVMMDQTPEGLRIQLVDQDGKPMFQPGTAIPMPYTAKLLAAIAKTIDTLPNRVSISGHTDGKPFVGANGMTNWELSAARANAARAMLSSAGLDSDRIYEVAGKAGSEPLLPEDPQASANRRLSIVLLREAPPTPPGAKF